ncbi:MAG: ATP-binding domain-containing protein, partial [Pseudonocardiaceae bacterium]
ALTAQQVFEQAFPGKHIANLTSEKTYATDVFSQFIKHYWNDVLQVPPASAPFAIDQGIVNNLDKLTRNAAKAAPAIINMVREWWVRNQPVIQAWLSLHATGGMSEAEFFEQLRDNLLGYEISHNAVRQSLMNQKNRERKQRNAEAKADLVVSTIHGAKGMEFDNVVVLHKEDTTMAQDMRRLYYVAFTRAMKSMHVLSYGTVAKAPIQANYDTLVTLLEQRDAANAARSADAADLDRETPDPLDHDASPQPNTSAPRLAVGATPDDPYDPLEPDVMAHAS